MPREIIISDEAYERLEALAEVEGKPITEMLERWIAWEQANIEQRERRQQQWRTLYQGMGLDEETISRLLEIPYWERDKRDKELRKALAAKREAEESQRDPLKEPRYLTFEQFFRELGHTDEEIAEAKRRAAEHANL